MNHLGLTTSNVNLHKKKSLKYIYNRLKALINTNYTYNPTNKR